MLNRAVAGCVEVRLQWTGTFALLLKAEACLAAGRPDASQVAAACVEQARAHG